MIRYTVFLTYLLLLSHAVQAACPEDSTVIGAKYTITAQNTKTHAVHTHHLILWRNGKQVAHQYPDTGITEVWQQTSNGMLRLVQYFDKHQRGIEYQPNEVNHGKGETNWPLKDQLITDKAIKSMQRTSTHGTGCSMSEDYTLTKDGKSISLTWLPGQRLMKTYHEKTASTELKWELVDIIDSAKRVKRIFSARQDYQTTDYIDIGDNESDPFFLKMINLGFVAHGGSGFYDADGHAIGDHHH